MFKFSSSLVAVSLAVTAFAVSAQDTHRSDMFGQEASSVSDTTAAAPTRKVTIANVPSTLASMPSPAQRASDDDADQADPRARMTRLDAEQRKREVPSEFQKFIFDNTGKLLPIFGTEFFAHAPSTFAPILNSPVPRDYPLGPGDELLIRGWGTIDIDYRAIIDRNGTISIPNIGSIVLAGVKAGEAESVVRGAIAKLYKGVTVNVNFGQLRAITVYVVGQASRPGTYTVSSMSTLVTALFASGGPNKNGSMRHVQVKRAGKTVAELDLYAFIAKGDKSADIKLQDGDSIYIPPAGGYVALVGKVNTPAIYEIKSGDDKIESVLDFAGGLPVVADPRRVFLERIDANKSHPRSVEEFALNGEGLKRVLKNGDMLNVTSITPDFSNAVVLRGNVDQPVRVPFTSGMRVSDLIPSREYLITRDSTKRQNNYLAEGDASGRSDARGSAPHEDNDRSFDDFSSRRVRPDAFGRQDNVLSTGDVDTDRQDAKHGDSDIAAQIGSAIDQINWEYAVIERVNRADLSVKLIPFNLGNVFTNPSGPDNVQLQPDDTVTIFSQKDVAVPMEKRRVFVRVEGEVKVPGVYQMTAGDTIQSLLAKAGGPTSDAYLFGTAFYREQVRKEQEINLDKAARRLESQLQSEESKATANLRATSGADAQAAVAQRAAAVQIEKEAISRFRQMKPTGRIAFGMEPGERSFARLPQIKLENGDRLVIPAKPAFVHVFGAVNAEASPLWRPNSKVKDYLDVAGLNADADVDNTFVMRVDGTVVSNGSRGWFSGGVNGLAVMPGDSIVIPEKFDKETAWTKFTQGTREWAQILANFGLGAAAIKTLSN